MPRQLLAVDVDVMGVDSKDLTIEFVVSNDGGETLAETDSVWVRTSGTELQYNKVGVDTAYQSINDGDGAVLDLTDYDSIKIRTIYDVSSEGNLAELHQKAALAAAINIGESVVEAFLDGNTTAGGSIKINADLEINRNDTEAASNIGTGFLQSKFQGSRLAAPSSFFSKLLGQNTTRAYESSETESSASGSIAFAQHANDVTARIGSSSTNPTTVISQAGDVLVSARGVELPEVSSRSIIASSSGESPFLLQSFYGPGAQPGLENTRDRSTSLALAGGNFQTDVKAFVGNSADVRASGAIDVLSESAIPYEIQWHQIDGDPILFIFDKLNGDFGIQNGFFTSWAQASARAKEKAYGGSFDVLRMDNSSKAYAAENARLTAGGAIDIEATGEIDVRGSVVRAGRWQLILRRRFR